MGVKKSRGWLTLVYPESAPEYWQDTLAEIGQMCVISPLHEHDVNQGTEEQKKPHYHVLLLWDGPTTEKCAKGTVSLICGVGCFPCASVRGSVRYFCHMDNPDKYQYDKNDLKQIGGLDLESLITSESDEELLIKEMYEFIKEYNIIYYSDFVDYCCLNNDEWFRLITHKYRENIYKYMRSLEYKQRKELEYAENEQGTTSSYEEIPE